jgi:hypothetical protein
MLVDGSSVAGNATISAWMQNGHGYASSKLAGVAPIPWTILCNQPQGVCTGTLSGNVTQVFANGKQLRKFPLLVSSIIAAVNVLTRVPELWGWATPSGHCDSGICYGSLTTLDDPAY